MDLPKFEDIFEPITKNLVLMGIYEGNSRLGLQFYILCFDIFLMLIEESTFFVSKISTENFLELTALAPCMGIGLLSFVKIIAIAMKRQQIFELTERLRDLYHDIVHDEGKQQLVKDEIVLVKSLTKYYSVLNIVLISVYNFSTLVLMLYTFVVDGKVVYSLPYAIIVPLGIEVWWKWLIVYIHSIASGFICVLFFITTDALYCNLSSQMCCNFRILSNELEKLTPTNADSLNSIVKRHQYLMTLSETLEDIFSAPNLFNVLAGSVEICALGFNIMTGDWSQMPGFILFLLSEILQIFCMSVFGENIMRESARVGKAAFLCEWYNMQPKYKKIILIIMTRSQKPQKLTAYKFSVISYQSFTKIISTSWSYFTILKTVYKPSDAGFSGE